jgi:hypothetical protein
LTSCFCGEKGIKVISDTCWVCKNLDRDQSTGDIPICSLLAVDEKIETEGRCPDFEDLES